MAALEDAQAGGHVIAGQLMAAAGAELVSGADGAEAVYPALNPH